MWICDRWMQEGTMDRPGQSHPPQCTTSLEDRQIVQWSIRKTSIAWSTLGAELQRRLCCQWCDERRMCAAEWNEVVLTDESRICLQHHDGRIRVWRHHGERMLNSCVMPHNTGLAPDIMIELLHWLARSPDLLPIENIWSMVAQQLTKITPPAATPDQLWQRVEAAWSTVPQKNTPKVSLNQCRGMWQW
ncbi:transposable element Tcb1 transposase [Trichonephila clavipes]|nr:transposable element Tcb1 transposase [Trichonephila clavipes]